MIGRILLACTILVPLFCHGGLISISTTALQGDGSNVVNNGAPIFAWNVNGNAVESPVVNGIAFANTQPGSVAIAGFPAIVTDDTGTSRHYSSSMGEVMGDYIGTNANANGTKTSLAR